MRGVKDIAIGFSDNRPAVPSHARAYALNFLIVRSQLP